MKATANTYLNKGKDKDKLKPGEKDLKKNKSGKYGVSIRITYNRKSKYFTTGLTLTPEEYESVTSGKPRGDLKKTAIKLEYMKVKANQIIAEMPIFTFAAFEKRFHSNKATNNNLKDSFDSYIAELKADGRIGSAVTYECAINSIESFKPGLAFGDVTPELLRKYERWMLDKPSSVTTVGIYMRSLRTIFNNAISDGSLTKDFYPFGRKKYEIPTSQNTKKALNLTDIGKIFNYEAPEGSTREMAKDYWVFMYLCNGINVKDMALLKYGDINGDQLEFIRAKTARTKRKIEPIRIILPERALQIIEKHGTGKRNPNSYVFPILTAGITAEKERDLIKNITHVINDHIKAIGEELEISQKITTYSARHSFATVLQRSGVSTEFISEALGHSNINVTKNYLAGFEDESKRKASELLTNF